MTEVTFTQESFWHFHKIYFIIFMFIFPRLTMLVTGIFLRFMGVGFFFAWLIFPRLTVACLATHFYWHTNPVLCFLAWMWAVGGELTEKTIVERTTS